LRLRPEAASAVPFVAFWASPGGRKFCVERLGIAAEGWCFGVYKLVNAARDFDVAAEIVCGGKGKFFFALAVAES